MKRCPVCGIEKQEKEFYKNRTTKDGLQRKCKGCIKQYYEDNKKRLLEYSEGYRKNNKEKIANKDKLYYEKNRCKIRAQCKIYRGANKELVTEQKKYTMKQIRS